MSNNDNGYPHQKHITVNKEDVTKDHTYFYLFKDYVSEASKVLTGAAFKLYVYLASNQDGYSFWLSQKAFENAFGVKKNGYYSSVQSLIDCGYLVLRNENSNQYDFYEFPKKEYSPKRNDLDTFPKKENVFPESETYFPKKYESFPEEVEKYNNITNITLDNNSNSSNEELQQIETVYITKPISKPLSKQHRTKRPTQIFNLD